MIFLIGKLMVKDIRHKELRDLVWLMKYIRIKSLTEIKHQ